MKCCVKQNLECAAAWEAAMKCFIPRTSKQTGYVRRVQKSRDEIETPESTDHEPPITGIIRQLIRGIMRPFAIAAADLQISYSTYRGYTAMWGDSYFALEQCVDHAIQHRCQLLLGGDVLDAAYPDSYSMRQVLAALRRLEREGLRTLFIQGNHEVVRRQPWLSIEQIAEHIHARPILFPDCLLYGIDYQPPGQIAAEMAKIPNSDGPVVLLLHQAWEELMGSRGDAKLADLVPDSVAIVISGDFHGHRAIKLTNRNGHPFVLLSPGSTNLRSVSEDPRKFCYLIYEDLTFRSLPILGRHVGYSTINGDQDVQPVIDASLAEFAAADNPRLPEHIRTPMWVVDVRNGVDVSKIRQAAGGRAHLFVRPFSAGEKNEENQEIGSAATVAEAVRESVEDGPLRHDVLRLWDSQDLKSTLDEIIKTRREEFEKGAFA